MTLKYFGQAISNKFMLNKNISLLNFWALNIVDFEGKNMLKANLQISAF